MEGTRVFILLATYNGAKYIREQIESIRAQSWRHWALLVRDDGSTDGTPDLLADMARQDGRISVVAKTDADGGPGVISNFGRLIQVAANEGAEYALFCDQDDVWLPNKIDVLMGEMRRAESAVGNELPLLVYSDLKVVDDQLDQISPSFLKFQGIRHETEAPLRVLLPQNFVTGCAALFNRPLLDLAVPLPPDVIMHDWWLALLAASAGEIRFVREPLVLYRQHGNNQVGAKPLWARALSLRGIVERIRRDQGVRAGVNQAKMLAARLCERDVRVVGGAQDLIQFYTGLHTISRYARWRGALKLRIGPQHPIRRAAFFARLMRTPRPA